jgi:hypothetical protein
MRKHESPEPGSGAIVSTATVDATSIRPSGRQISAVGPAPGVEDLFVGALLFSTVAEVSAVARFIESEDLDQPASTVLASIKALASRGVPPGPQLVKDDLQRRGKFTRTVAKWLAAATTSGACSSAARDYAAALLAEAFRRQVESFGVALAAAAPSAAEGDVARLAEQASARIRYTFGRLTELRGDVDD